MDMDLSTRLEEINNIKSVGQKRRLHFRSLRNFIEHLNDLQDTREEVQGSITKYIEIVGTHNYKLTFDQSVKYYYEFIEPVGKVYGKNGGFILVLGNRLLFPFFILPNIIILVLFHFSLLSIILAAGTLIYLGWRLTKNYSHKIYGLLY
jgi:hypothetical protein